MADFLSGLGNAAATFAKGTGQILTGDWQGAWNTAGGNPYSPPKPTTTTTSTPKPQPTNTGIDPSSYQMSADTKAMIDATNRQIAESQAARAAAPKLIYRDTNAAWQGAQNTAATSVNPVYQDNLNRKIKEMADLRLQAQASATAGNSAADTTLGQTTEDIATTHQRTAEDTASAIAQSLTNEGNWQTSEGKQSNATEEAARLAMGDQGIAGRGAGQLYEAKVNRNDASNQTTKQFTNERDTKKLLETRTFQDLNTKGVRAEKLNETQKADIDRKLADFITNQGNEDQSFRATNEAARLSALQGATEQQYKTDTAAWLGGLAKGGTRNQDLALATQVYGGR